MRRIARQILRDHEVSLLRYGTLRLPAPDALPEVMRGGNHRLLDVAAAAPSSAADVSQRRGMRMAAADQRLTPGHTSCATLISPTEDFCGRANWSQQPACGRIQQHQQQRCIRLFEVPWATCQDLSALHNRMRTLYMHMAAPRVCTCARSCEGLDFMSSCCQCVQLAPGSDCAKQLAEHARTQAFSKEAKEARKKKLHVR